MFWAQRKAKIILADRIAEERRIAPREPFGKAAVRFFNEMDIIGLLLVATSLALILLPLSLANLAKGGWSNPSMIAMEVIGACLFPVFCFYEAKFAKYPIVPYRFLKNLTILASCIIGFTDFVSFYLQVSSPCQLPPIKAVVDVEILNVYSTPTCTTSSTSLRTGILVT
jgi:hypothetical protein